MKVLHVVPGLDVVGNGIAVAAKLLAAEQGADLVEARLFAVGEGGLGGYDEVWVHSCWLPMTLKSCCRVLRAGKPLVRMTHANLDPVRLKYHCWKKWLVGPIERWCLRRCDRIVATCEAEKGWIQAYLGKHCPPIEVTDIKRFFRLGNREQVTGNSGKTGLTCFPTDRPLHLLYLGRRHPLKGLSYLESALATYYNMLSKPTSASHSSEPHNTTYYNMLSKSQIIGVPSGHTSATYYNKCSVEFSVVSNAFGEELEKVWDWCDVLVLPTLSDNFGLVIAEALERGKRVITTDGAPVWGEGLTGFTGLHSGYGGRLIYLIGYRGGSDETRVELLKKAIERICQ